MTLPLVFGANVDPTWRPAQEPLRRALDAEQLGFDLITVQDHPYQAAFYDTWTLLTYLAARTERITLVPTVAPLPLRPPAILAKSAASLDVLTGGRVQLGLGTGAFWDAIAAMDGPRRSPKEAVDALEEAIAVIRAMWSGQRSARVAGDYHQLAGIHPGPPPGPGLGIWLGAYGPRMLTLTGAKADGWLPSHAYLGLDKLAAASRRVDDAATEAGRDPAAIRKIYNIAGVIGDESGEPFGGSAQQWIDQLVTVVGDNAMNGFVFWPAADHDRQLRRFAEDVVPGVRAALAR
ncbi:alkanesulfonate monooxygenase SsuD/methylene tetrahydromethanopterin reductase-like flavin-dependent oxidoreductase (luciferase family) [Actinoplanes lutulentus]|uniref:Luciferase-like monooxygenase n=1 Tax=Actinoplanes lutulentus TaxID=1287878 RepID=A0A327Z6J0_9ACTN|nr:LLM class flavin-dependent oxidoreductase [Actinoplanes lutulentus]MBB2943379.1 alkanesulfonate monooxygenase SsuD/methylene tetrahydromethanopterin reductase-like flavin-dependent oxidoreductase (luciferase family) [Actinoplanes lutulentus]RAK28437.1 luciferase-like monooxygenase [Actinoplanes lutulentus]